MKIPDLDSAQQQLKRPVQRINRNFPDRVRTDYQLRRPSKRYAQWQGRNYSVPLTRCGKKQTSWREIDVGVAPRSWRRIQLENGLPKSAGTAAPATWMVTEPR